MPLNQLVYILALTLNIVLLVLILTQNRRDRRSIVFALLVVSTSYWVFSSMMADLASDYETAMTWARQAIIGPTFTQVFFLYFTWIYPIEKKLNFFKVLVLIIPVAILIPFVGTTANVTEIVMHDWGVSVQGGELYYFLLFTLLLYFGTGLQNLFRSLSVVPNNIKSQVKLMIYGVLVTLIIGIFTNLILVVIGDNGASSWGPSSTIFFILAMAYAIYRHRFLDARLLLGRTVYYALLGLLAFTAFYLFYFVDQLVFGTSLSIGAAVSGLFFSFGFVWAFNAFNKFVRTQVDSRLINPGFDPAETTEQLSNSLSLRVDDDEVTKEVLDTLKRTIRPAYAAIIIFPDNQQVKVTEQFVSSGGQLTLPASIETTLKTLWTSTVKEPVIIDEIGYEIEDGIYHNVPNLANDAGEKMKAISAKVIFPLGSSESIKGMLVLGQKEADYPYTTQDLNFIKSISNATSLAVERALLYREVQQFADTLQVKVNEATAELQKTNKDLEGALAALQEARRQERDMIDVMGHELRTPISIVRNALAMLTNLHKDNEPLDPAKHDQYLNMALESTRREITLIETLLSATKIDASRLQLHLEKVDLNDVVRDGIEGQRNLLEQRHIQVNYTSPDENNFFVFSDRTRTQEIMDNLLSNAIKYTLEGQIDITGWSDEKNCWISVKDTGIGIDREDLLNLGKKFFRAKQYIPKEDEEEDGTKVVRPGGTGLGLYVTFELVRIMSGELYIQSYVGEGSTFVFSLPKYLDQGEKQVDQTFERDLNKSREHIHIGVLPDRLQ